MRVIYIADDGTQFDDEYECKDYEWLQKHSHLKDIQLYDEEGYLLDESILSEYGYNHAWTVVVKTLDAAIEMDALAQYTGFCAYEDINRVGVWTWDKDKEMFRLVVGAEV